MSPKVKKILPIVVGVAVILCGYFVYDNYVNVSSDNAQIDAHYLLISARVGGTISKVLVVENQKVKAGDVLAEIDPADYQNAKVVADAQVSALEARYNEAKVSFDRATNLIKGQAISKEKYDQASANFRDTEAKLNAAKSQASQAALNLSYTHITAAESGTIARKSVEPGQFVSVGVPLFGFVSGTERWVTANLKETELKSVRIGQKVKVDVDASGATYYGKVDSIAPSTGAVFSLLPPDNATGNFTKVVQRVPVKIILENLSEKDISDLQLGLSVIVSIRVH